MASIIDDIGLRINNKILSIENNITRINNLNNEIKNFEKIQDQSQSYELIVDDTMLKNKQQPNDSFENKNNGNFMPVEAIIKDINKNFLKIEETYNKASDKNTICEKIIHDYLKKYYVEYKFTTNNNRTITIDYMKSKQTYDAEGCTIDIEYLKLAVDGCYCILSPQKNLEIKDSKQAKPLIYFDQFDVPFIQELYVPPEQRKKGYGANLICTLAKFAKERLDIHELQLYPSSFRHKALSQKDLEEFYFKLGFKKIGSRMKASVEDIIKLARCS